MFRPKPTPIRADVANSLKVNKGHKAPSVNSEDYVGLAAFDASLYENQHKHGNHKQVLHSIDTPVVNVHTEKVSEYQEAPIVRGIALSPEQLAAYNNSQYK